MHRKLILQLLDSYETLCESDKIQREKIRRFVEENRHCFERTLTEGHLTGSAWVVSPDRNCVLLTHHGKIGKWLQLGGHADGDPDIFAVALREAREESGLQRIQPLSSEIFDIDIHRIPASLQEAEHYHYDVRFIFEADPTEPVMISSESKELAWVPISSLKKPEFDLSIRRMVHKTTQYDPRMQD